jgi:hypothetical protein
MANIIQIRRDTSANWTAANSLLASGEMGLETDTSKFKFGDGVTPWNSLIYAITAGTTQIWSGQIVIDFGGTATDEAQYVVTGLSNMTATAKIYVFIQDDDSTVDNSAVDHATLAYSARCSAGERVPTVGFTIFVRNIIGKARGTYKVNYFYVL